ncbi:hypothetical protein SAMN06265173_102142 [Thalassovita litoralis]|uniref:Uncharacterized protein n=1 Tax=Thalassovita litoralis TaxID=1010611 RepID=A0A521B5E2_9RHOB|nr:hypothetical protein [Thalassovita litoralis]SMO42312.1 hypothetical protein SAMN06265173_102142 [Thalassovita litoralis]
MKQLLKHTPQFRLDPKRFLRRQPPAPIVEQPHSLRASGPPPPGPMPIRLQRALDIPVLNTSPEQSRREYVVARGQFLARQDMWEELGSELRHHDQNRSRTTADMPLADLLSYGARADVAGPLSTQIRAGRIDPADVENLPALTHLEHALDDTPDDYGVALVVLHALLDVAWAFHGIEPTAQPDRPRARAFHACMTSAADILDRFDPFEENSPALAAARCALLPGQSNPQSRVVDDYEDLIELDPQNPGHMRDFGHYMLPRWFGSYQQLEVQARRMAALTRDIWGAGGYTWTYLDALRLDGGVLELLEAELFIEGMQNILHRRPDQHTANIFAAFCSVTLCAARMKASPHQPQLTALRGAFDWVLTHHLREVHPLIWALAEKDSMREHDLTYNEKLAEKGRGSAFRRIARHFETDIRNGGCVVFGEKGPQILPRA